jgi:hypothetical protein
MGIKQLLKIVTLAALGMGFLLSGCAPSSPASQAAAQTAAAMTQTASSPTQAVSGLEQAVSEELNCWTVQAGNNLYRIGLAMGVDYHMLAAYNDIPDSAVISIGQKICYPLDLSVPADSSGITSAQEVSGMSWSIGDTISVDITYYNPIRDGTNCGDDCRVTASGIRVLADDFETPISGYWWDPAAKTAGVACPRIFPFGTVFRIKLGNGESADVTCIDRGGAITAYNAGDKPVVRLDVLNNDGFGPGDEGLFSLPTTLSGAELYGRLDATIVK